MRRILDLLALLALTTPLLTVPGNAALRVLPEAAHRGAYGLRADVTRTCTGDDTVLVSDPVDDSRHVQACREVIVAGEVTATGSLTAVGGRTVVFADSFRVAPGGHLEAGTTGRSPESLLEPSPAGEPELFVRLHARFDGAALPAGESVSILGLTGTRDGPTTVGATVRFEGGTGPDGQIGTLRLAVIEDDGQSTVSDPVTVTEGWHALELHWDAGSALAADGRAELLLDGRSALLLEDLATSQGVVDDIRVGAWDGTAAGGWIDLDDVAAARSGPIGPAGGAD
ncbi:MAG: hypothetical protein PVI57_24470 [Gemmatimonadota bacterium]